MSCVYTLWHAEGRFGTRGVKSESVTARVAVGSARSAKGVIEMRILYGLY